tara:strand:+ start:5486 stop:7213 length:1728 start_codon:yes stop_codon:yes gene_type:complete
MTSSQSSTQSSHPNRPSEVYRRLFYSAPDWEEPRDLPDVVAKSFVKGGLDRDYYGLKIEVDDDGYPQLWSETEELSTDDIFEWIIGKEVVTSVESRGYFDSIFKVLWPRNIKELAVLGKTEWKGTTLSIPGNSPWLTVSRGNKTGKLINLHSLFSLQKEFSNLTDPSHFRKGAELAHAKLWNAGLGDCAIRSPGQLIESLVLRKVYPKQVLPADNNYLHVHRFANSFKPARIEGNIFGINEVIDYDISSAFPATISELVDLNQIYWVDSTQLQSEAVYAAVRCDLEINPLLIRGPISVRFGENSSFFPIGPLVNVWLGKPEIDLLSEYPDLGRITKVHEGSWGLIKSYSEPLNFPFRKLLRNYMYTLRRNDPFLSGFLKLSMAALWGKFISSYRVQDSFEEDPYTRASCLYNPIFASHVTSDVRTKLYKSSLGKEVVGEFVDGIALIDSTRTQGGFGGLSEEGSGTMILFDDQYKGCEWKNSEIVEFARGSKNMFSFEVPRNYLASLPFAYRKYGGEAIEHISVLESTSQKVRLGPARRFMEQYRVGDFFEYSIPTVPPKMTDLMSILYQRRLGM